MQTSGGKRIELLDILRGFAIFGTLGTNIWIFAGALSLATLFTGGTSQGLSNYTNAFDVLVHSITYVFTNGKFLSLLTILFGVGLEIQYQQAKKKGQKWPVMYLWRTLLLLADGFIHYLFIVEFDILMSYAVVAIIVSFLVGRSDRVINIAMVVTGSFHFIAVTLITLFLATSTPSEIQATQGTPITDIATLPTYWAQIGARWENFWLYRTESIFVIPFTTFLFLLGIKLFRAGIFAPDEAGKQRRIFLLKVFLPVGFGLALLDLIPGGIFTVANRYLFSPVMALGYLGLISWLCYQNWFDGIKNSVAKVGKMALSCYMLQNVLASLIFYKWGLGLTGQIGAVGVLVVFVIICLILTVFCHFWLKKFAAGPFETVWKKLSLMPFRSQAQTQTRQSEA
jgi:uncharacterized protein